MSPHTVPTFSRCPLFHPGARSRLPFTEVDGFLSHLDPTRSMPSPNTPSTTKLTAREHCLIWHARRPSAATDHLKRLKYMDLGVFEGVPLSGALPLARRKGNLAPRFSCCPNLATVRKWWSLGAPLRQKRTQRPRISTRSSHEGG